MAFEQKVYREVQSEAPDGFTKMIFVWHNRYHYIELTTPSHEYKLSVKDNGHPYSVTRALLDGQRRTHGHYGDAVLEQWPVLNGVVTWFQAHPNAIKEFRIRGYEFDLKQFEAYAEELRQVIKALKGETSDGL